MSRPRLRNCITLRAGSVSDGSTQKTVAYASGSSSAAQFPFAFAALKATIAGKQSVVGAAMPYLPYLYELSPLYLLQAAFTIWLLVDANKRRVEMYWFWIILVVQPLGAWAYFFIYKAKDIQGGSGFFGNLGNLFHRPPSLAELRHRVEQLPTVANQLALGERLVETGAHAEALPYLQAVAAREPNHCQCLHLLAQCHRQLGRPEQAVPLLETIISRNSSWN